MLTVPRGIQKHREEALKKIEATGSNEHDIRRKESWLDTLNVTASPQHLAAWSETEMAKKVTKTSKIHPDHCSFLSDSNHLFKM